MKLFKYLSPDRLDVLVSRRIRFTQPVDFNDPFEFSPTIKALVAEESEGAFVDQVLAEVIGDDETFAKTFEAALDEHAGALPAELRALITPEMGLAMIGPDIRNLFLRVLRDGAAQISEKWRPETRERVGRMVGVLSLAEQPDNLLMWAHYAAAHRGIVIGFDSEHPYFDQRKNDSDMIRRLERVRYSKERPAAVILNPSVPEKEHAAQFAENFFLTKSSEWAYEREWRMLRSIEEASVKLNTPQGDVHLFDVPEEAVTDVILGCRIAAADRDTLLALRTEGRYSGARWSEACVDPTLFAVRINQLEEK